MTPQYPTLVLFDGDFFLHRCLHVPDFQTLRSEDGVPTGGVYGVLYTLQTALKKFPNLRKAIIVWDTGHSVRRMTLLPSYKANRAAQPGHEEEHEEHRRLFREQKEMLQIILPAFGLRQAILPCKEGDDILAWFVRKCPQEKVIVTEDKDLLQLVSRTTAVYQPIKDKFISLRNFRQELGVPRELYLLRKAMLGDKSDNIEGVPSVGETTVDRVMSEATRLYETREADTLSALLLKACSVQMEVDTRNRKRYASLMEGTEVVRRNLDLMDLRREPFTPEEDAELQGVLDSAQGCFHETEVIRILAHLSFEQFQNDLANFSRPFRELR